jgi:hypothetical protein
MNHRPQKPEHELDADLRSLDQRLSRQMPVDPPPGLADRVFAATVEQLPGTADRRPIVGRIGFGSTIMLFTRRAALAAALLLGVFSVWWAVTHPDQPTTGDRTTLTVAQVDAITRMLESPDDTYAGRLEQLEQDLAELDMIVASAWSDEPVVSDDSLETDLMWLDEQLEQF